MYTELFSPIYATQEGLPIIVIGVWLEGKTPVFLFVEGAGKLGTAAMSEILVDVRYGDSEWHDVSPGTVDVEE